MDRISLACVELIRSECLLGDGPLYNACELPAGVESEVPQLFQRIALPDYPMWTGSDESPVRSFSAPGLLLRQDGLTAESWLHVRGQTLAHLSAACIAVPGRWAPSGRGPSRTQLMISPSKPHLSSRPREADRTGRSRYAVPPHSVTVVPGPDGRRAADGPRDAASSPAPQTPAQTAPLGALDGSTERTTGPTPGNPRRRRDLPTQTYLFAGQTAQRIVEGQHRDNYGLTAAFGYDGALTFTRDATYRDEPGAERVTPDAPGRHAIGGLWCWDTWPETDGTTPQP
ncbi:hypothetical protein GCM10010286_31340 [Streptomyces toxytricini]|nr:hypothetical protein GCM10010286_31340 [Streptomyces toxytricini]